MVIVSNCEEQKHYCEVMSGSEVDWSQLMNSRLVRVWAEYTKNQKVFSEVLFKKMKVFCSNLKGAGEEVAFNSCNI